MPSISFENYSYFTDAGKGINYVTNIHYTDAEVDFEYRSRTDADPVSIGSVSQQQSVLLHTIRIKFKNKKVREYRLLDELVSGNRRMNQVQLCGFDEGWGEHLLPQPAGF